MAVKKLKAMALARVVSAPLKFQSHTFQASHRTKSLQNPGDSLALEVLQSNL